MFGLARMSAQFASSRSWSRRSTIKVAGHRSSDRCGAWPSGELPWLTVPFSTEAGTLIRYSSSSEPSFSGMTSSDACLCHLPGGTRGNLAGCRSSCLERYFNPVTPAELHLHVQGPLVVHGALSAHSSLCVSICAPSNLAIEIISISSAPPRVSILIM